MNIRYTAAQVVQQVLAGKSLSDTLTPALKNFTDARDSALTQAIAYGVCRRFYSLSACLRGLLPKPLKAKDQDVFALLLVGLFQLSDMRIPAYAAVAETVAAVKKLKKPWAKNLVNAVLRQQQRQAPAQPETEAVIYDHPVWFIQALRHAWPTQWQAILNANNQHPPMALRVNQVMQTRADYLAKLAAAGIPAAAIGGTTHGVVLATGLDVGLLPGFAGGESAVQDGAAQLAAPLLQLAPGLRVLDACAAPGGKTAHIAAAQPDLQEIVALDRDADRLAVVTENVTRLRCAARVTCVTADAGDLAQWWDGRLFDRILLDAPCSASGVIRRHPDIKLLRQPDDIAALAAAQTRLLLNLWTTLKPDGLLLYATCSVLPAENSAIVSDFLTRVSDARVVPLTVEVGLPMTVGLQILPGQHAMDGFYYALLRKC